MGVKGLWELLRKNPGVKVTSLTDWFVNDAVARINDSRNAPVIGVDASTWIYEAQAAVMQASKHRAAWARIGQPAIMKCILDRLLQLIKLPVAVVFVFDGNGRPQYKRGRKVKTKPHYLTGHFQAFIKAFGFHTHTAPGEAEAELAWLNLTGQIDYVLTSDVDVFIFGATSVIRRPLNKDNYDEVEIYHVPTLQAYERVRLSRAGLIFIAIFGGGDYDPDGLKGFTVESAYMLAGHQSLVTGSVGGDRRWS
ncbi:hypothetical protein CC1G_02472 [Coprinopsis cinerea okayama7|uniref:XPG-I domain-containing protein n=1 Tax=Coprinopsis cinerea (strain Okayama-7 / 130 / ATCC MYA-4618 / FGSC 9003) TaxID=240176 RepID=A8NBL2_COPC7|nr:hypothetical protein CC1G_02472 [Coprinopsis cinerea okayama7\|eukprot:XP_001832210.2 hypothetical protein CC1G_02472 [Coprinopsis cinerea okayama7\